MLSLSFLCMEDHKTWWQELQQLMKCQLVGAWRTIQISNACLVTFLGDSMEILQDCSMMGLGSIILLFEHLMISLAISGDYC